MKKSKLNSKNILIGFIGVIVVALIIVLASQSELFSTESTEDLSNPFFVGAYLEYDIKMDFELGNSTEKTFNSVSGIMRQEVVEISDDSLELKTSILGEFRDIIGEEAAEGAAITIMKGETLFAFDIESMEFIGEITIETVFGDRQVIHLRSDEKSFIEGGTLHDILNIYVDKNTSILYLSESSSVTETVYQGGLLTNRQIMITSISDTNLEWLK